MQISNQAPKNAVSKKNVPTERDGGMQSEDVSAVINPSNPTFLQ